MAPLPHNALIPRDQLSDITPNNHQFDADLVDLPHPIFKEILRNHYIYPCLNQTASVPVVYLQQFWHTLVYDATGDSDHIIGMVEDRQCSVSLRRFRRLLQLPAEGEHPIGEYDDLPTKAQLCRDIVDLGYNNQLRVPAEFKRMYLAQSWACLFSIINRCTTSKTLGIDRARIQTLQFFHGVVYSRNYDFASLIWDEIKAIIFSKDSKKSRRFIPFMRYFSLIIQDMMNRNPNIPRRANEQHVEIKQMQIVRETCGHPTVESMPIPEELLQLVDDDNEYLITYRAVNNLEAASMESPEPEISSPEATHLGPSEGYRANIGERLVDNSSDQTISDSLDDIDSLSPEICPVIPDSDDNDETLEAINTQSSEFDTGAFICTPQDYTLNERADLESTPPSNIPRVTTSVSTSHVLTSCEQVVSCPLTHAQSQPSH